MHLKILIGMVVLIILIALLTFIYHRTAAYQQTLTITMPFEDTYRYVPGLDPEKKFKLDRIKVTITGMLKTGAEITPGDKVRQILQETIIQPYRNCLIVQDAHVFTTPEQVLKRCPVTKSPTVENLSLLFFNQLASALPKIGGRLASVRVESGDLRASSYRYKISDYTM